MRAKTFFLCGLAAASALAVSVSSPEQAIAPWWPTDARPDVWAYTYVDSDTPVGTPGRPDYNWVDIRLIGNRVNGLVDDNVVGPFSLGFEFPLYWLRFSQYYVGSNGYISFDDNYNCAHPFPNIPSPLHPNNMLAAFLSDIDFTGLTGNKGCWTYMTPSADTFIIQCESVPFWNRPGSNNTFEMILSRPDSSITFQYKEQSGSPYTGWGPGSFTVGIENITGYQAGLCYNYGNTPVENTVHPGLAVRFIPPATSSYTINDVMCVNTMSANSGGMFMHLPITQPYPVWVRVMNSGNLPAGAFMVYGDIYDYSGMQVWHAEDQVTALAVGEVYRIDFGTWIPPVRGTYTLKMKTDYGSDQYRANDSILVEIRVVNYSFPTILYYDSLNTGSLSLSGPHGYCVRIGPPRYPVRLDSIGFYFSGTLQPIDVFVYDDLGGRPGAVLDSIRWTPTVIGWNWIVVTDDSINVQSGDVYVGYKTPNGNTRIGIDQNAPFSRQGWEYTGDWAPMRFDETMDMKIRLAVAAGASNHNLGVSEIVEPSAPFYDSGAVVPIEARVANVGWTSRDTGDVVFTLVDEAGAVVYADSMDSVIVARGRDTLLVFGSWSAVPNLMGSIYTPRCSVRTYSTDLDPTNDTLSGAPFYVRYTDVAALEILSPAETLAFGAVVTPTLVVRNHGNNLAGTVTVRFQIGASYDETQVVSLGARTEDTLEFTDWTAELGIQNVVAWVELAGDQVPGNDTVRSTTLVNLYDAGATRVVAPVGAVSENTVVAPSVVVRDYGTLGVTCDVRFIISDSTTGAVVYDTTETGIAIPGDDSVTVTFTKTWTATPQAAYLSQAYTIYALDPNPLNDTAAAYCRVVQGSFIDVAVTAIVEPTGTVPEFSYVRPNIELTNLGLQTEVCDLRVIIDDDGSAPYLYDTTETSVIVPLGAPVVRSLTKRWLATPQGDYRTWAQAITPGDMVPENDTLGQDFSVGAPALMDVGVDEIVSPAGSFDTSLSVEPQATLRNFGSLPATFRATFEIRDWNGAQVYLDAIQVTDLAPNTPELYIFAEWPRPHLVGNYTGRCSTYMVGDGNPSNDTLANSFRVTEPPPNWPTGWTEVLPSMPSLPSGRAVKDGGWLAHDLSSGLIYAAKGNKVGDFYSYDPRGDSWTMLSVQLAGAETKMPSKGAVGCADGLGSVFATKGNNTQGFWRYDIATDTWSPMPNVPLGLSNKKVKGGTDMVPVTINDTVYLYLLKGYRNEFYRFSTLAQDTWVALQPAPEPKYDRGSFLVFDGDHTIYAHRARYHVLDAFNVQTGNWSTVPLSGMGFVSQYTARAKKSKDGGSGAWGGDGIYALKGGNTQEFWHYDVAADTWTENETIPAWGSTQRRKKVKGGGDITAYGDSAFFALKGNKCLELWRYVKAAVPLMARAGRDGVMAGQSAIADCRLTIAPNPLASGFATIRLSGPVSQWPSGLVRVFDATGRCVLTRPLEPSNPGTFSLDLRTLANGVYLARVTSTSQTVACKLVVER